MSAKPEGSARKGALVLSLDFELAWGVRDRVGVADGYSLRLYGAREAIPRILDLFAEFDVAATWATVGFLFAESRAEIEELSPRIRPAYRDARLSPYEDVIGDHERDDPLHYAPSLIRLIATTPRQELASHTFSHYYVGERGQDIETFRADLKAAISIARRRGFSIRSIVFPRNQHNSRYDCVLRELGIQAYRGNPASYAWRFADDARSRSVDKRALRLLDSYGGPPATTPWSLVRPTEGLSNIRASFPLRPYVPSLRALDGLRLHRIRKSLQYAARKGEIFHLWWHPHNFGSHVEENLWFLREILQSARRLRDEGRLASLTMHEVAQLACSR